jgi:hypothetical protein
VRNARSRCAAFHLSSSRAVGFTSGIRQALAVSMRAVPAGLNDVVDIKLAVQRILGQSSGDAYGPPE